MAKFKESWFKPLSLTVLALTVFCLVAENPRAQRQRLDNSGNVREESYIRIPLPESEQAYSDIDGHQMKEILQEVVAISLRSRDDGNKYWGRISGTKYEKMAQSWTESKYRALGMKDIHKQVFNLSPQWFPTSWDVQFVNEEKTQTFDSLLPAMRSSPTPKEGLDLEAVWVGTGSSADFSGRNVRGKAVFIHSIPAPGSMGHSASESWEGSICRAQEAGAAAIFVIYGVSDNFAIWQSLGRGVTVPGFFMGYHDGTVVREMLGRGERVRVHMKVDVEIHEELTSASVWGTLPGRTDENIIIMAHLDGYFEAALDNASGLSVMMTLAEHFAKLPQEQRRRNLIFIGTAGHHVGSPGARWLHENRKTALAKTALMINCEHVSVKQTVYWGPKMRKTDSVSPRRWWVNGSDRLLEIVLGAYQTFGVSVWDEMETRSAGEMSRVARDAPSVQIIRSPEIKHTDADTVEWVPEAGLEAVARAYAKIIDRVNRLEREDLLPRLPTE